MKREFLKERKDKNKNETREALQEFYDFQNKGQKQKALKSEKIKTLLERYGVITDEEIK